jgi:hypothetical protein
LVRACGWRSAASRSAWDSAGGGDAGADLGASLRCRRQNEVGGGDGRHFDLEIDTVEQRSRDAGLIALGATAAWRQAKPGSPARPQRQGFMAATS